MNYALSFIIVGIVSGSVYGLAGVGLVLTYKVSGIFNFAYGAVATIAAYFAYVLSVQHNVPIVVAAPLSIVVVGVLIGLGFERLAESLSRARLAMRVSATVGVLLIVESIATIVYGSNSLDFPNIFPSGEVRIFRTNVGYSQISIFGISMVATVVLYVFLRRSRLGKAMRAVVDDAALLDLAGTDPVRVRRWAWIIGSVFAAAAGLLLAPSLQLSPTTLSLLVAQAFGAAAIGRFTSLPVTWCGGLVIGVAISLVDAYVNSTSPILSKLGASLPFAVLFLTVIFARRQSIVGRGREVVRRQASALHASLSVRVLAALLAVVFFCLVPLFAGFQVSGWTGALTDIIIVLSLGLLVREAGQVSLCQVTFVAVGAAVFSHLAVGFGVPWGLAILCGGLSTIPIGVIISIPAMRLGGLYLALCTFGLGYLVQAMFYTSNLMFGTNGVVMPTPSLSWLDIGSPVGYYYLVLAITVLVCVAIVILNESRLGRLLRGISEASLAMTVSGISVNVAYCAVFCISGFLAAIGGALEGVSLGVVNGLAFDPIMSLTLLMIVIITLGDAPFYAIAAGLALGLIPTYLSGSSTEYLQLILGVIAVQTALTGPPRLPDRLFQLAHGVMSRMGSVDLGLARVRFRPWGRRGVQSEPQPALDGQIAGRRWSSRSPVKSGGADGLVVRDLHVQFGGISAVDGVSIAAGEGRITGLIGPNGAGKTSLFNACNGLVRPQGGQILLGGHEISSKSPAARARLGLGRTLQQMQLFDSLSVAENISMGREAALGGANPYSQIFSGRSDSARIGDVTREVLDLCGLASIANAKVGDLSTGQRRMVDVARCLAGDFSILLLDEPCSGLDAVEVRRFTTTLRDIVESRGVGILLVEHDMSFVLDVCEHIYVLDFGRLIFEGTPAEVARSSAVQEAYLGSAVSGTGG